MIVDRAQMLADFESLLIIESTVEHALAETARSYGYTIEQVRSAATAKFGDLDDYTWKISMRK